MLEKLERHLKSAGIPYKVNTANGPYEDDTVSLPDLPDHHIQIHDPTSNEDDSLGLGHDPNDFGYTLVWWGKDGTLTFNGPFRNVETIIHAILKRLNHI